MTNEANEKKKRKKNLPWNYSSINCWVILWMAVRNKDAESCVIAGIKTWNTIEVNGRGENILPGILTKAGFKSEYPLSRKQTNNNKKHSNIKTTCTFHSYLERKSIVSFPRKYKFIQKSSSWGKKRWKEKGFCLSEEECLKVAVLNYSGEKQPSLYLHRPQETRVFPFFSRNNNECWGLPCSRLSLKHFVHISIHWLQSHLSAYQQTTISALSPSSFSLSVSLL